MNTIDKIYELTYSPLLTPYNLLDNLSLDNYLSINYTKIDNDILSKITCLIDDRNIDFFYLFDEKQFLKEIYYYENNIKEYLFNRDADLTKYRSTYISSNYEINKCS